MFYACHLYIHQNMGTTSQTFQKKKRPPKTLPSNETISFGTSLRNVGCSCIEVALSSGVGFACRFLATKKNLNDLNLHALVKSTPTRIRCTRTGVSKVATKEASLQPAVPQAPHFSKLKVLWIFVVCFKL